MDTKGVLNLYVDLQTFSDQVKKFFHDVILGQRLGSIISLSSNIATELSNGETTVFFI